MHDKTRDNTIPFTRDDDGLEVAHVPLRDRQREVIGFAIVERGDLEALQAAGVQTPWFINSAASGHSYVNAPERKHRGRSQPVARVIMSAPNGVIVRYRDGNRRNLRRSNLYLTEHPCAKGKTPLTGSISCEKPERP